LSFSKEVWLDGSCFIILCDFLFSAFSLSRVIELPFLKFMRYMLTEKSLSAKEVKKL